jgi:hypothetical protein
MSNVFNFVVEILLVLTYDLRLVDQTIELVHMPSTMQRLSIG